MKLILESNFAKPDDFYQSLIDAHAGLSDPESERLNARLVLLLANHIGDLEAVGEAFKIARSLVLEGDAATPEA